MYKGVLVVPLTGKNPAWDSPSQPGTASPRMPVAPPEEDSQGFEELAETSSKWEDRELGICGIAVPQAARVREAEETESWVKSMCMNVSVCFLLRQNSTTQSLE